MAKDSSAGDTGKMERIVDAGVRLKKGIAMGGMESASNMDHGGKPAKLPTAKAVSKGSKSAY